MASFVSRGPGDRLWKKKDPAILATLEQLVQEDTAGDPSRRLKWKRQSLHQLSELLGSKHPASALTISRLLRDLDYSPKVNRKQLAQSSSHRDEQFRYLRSQTSLLFSLAGLCSASTTRSENSLIKISDEQMEEVRLDQHRVLPQWNYTIRPAMD
jgi:hypothetical protein